jgi:hypothetical protein
VKPQRDVNELSNYNRHLSRELRRSRHWPDRGNAFNPTMLENPRARSRCSAAMRVRASSCAVGPAFMRALISKRPGPQAEDDGNASGAC